jgi:hypothetical protein
MAMACVSFCLIHGFLRGCSYALAYILVVVMHSESLNHDVVPSAVVGFDFDFYSMNYDVCFSSLSCKDFCSRGAVHRDSSYLYDTDFSSGHDAYDV